MLLRLSLAIRVFILACLGASAGRLHAGGVDNRSDNSADYIRSLSRNAAVRGADAAVYNPAGTVRLPEGLLVGLDNQTMAKINRQGMARPAAAFKSDIISLLDPTGFAVLRRGGLAAFGSFSYPGGSGGLDYKRGSALVYPVQAALAAGDPARNAEVLLRSVYYGGTLGGAYAIGDWLSLSLAGRLLYARNEITVQAQAAEVSASGDARILIGHMEEARGAGAILGADLFLGGNLVLGLRAESATPLQWSVRRSRLDLDSALPEPALRSAYIAGLRQVLRPPGARFRRDLPMNAGLGLGYSPVSALRMDLSFEYYFNTLADWGGRENLHEDGWEGALGLEYAWPFRLRTSAGARYTVTGAGPGAYQMENPALDNYALGCGGRLDLSRRLGLKAGFAAEFSRTDRTPVPALGTSATLEKRSYTTALGLEVLLF